VINICQKRISQKERSTLPASGSESIAAYSQKQPGTQTIVKWLRERRRSCDEQAFDIGRALDEWGFDVGWMGARRYGRSPGF
jgi:hypothetical protein